MTMNTLFAAFMFFTRLPLWRIRQVPGESFKSVVNAWPYVGWLTGGVMVGIFYLTVSVLPVLTAVVLALCGRLLLTGALHEDGLADFCDGFGGGTDRARTLSIMKDSHIGSYGVIGLICYFLLLVSLLTSLPFHLTCMALIVGDTWSKFVAANLVNLLPYARKEEESKAGVVYSRMRPLHFVVALVGGLFWGIPLLPAFWPAYLLSALVFLLLVALMRKRIQGYTGDCCGAAFLLCELAFWVGICATYYVN